MSNAAISSAFESTLKTWADAQGIPVAWQNVSFDPPSGTYLEAFLIPARTTSETLDGAHRRYTGIFQVNVVMPIGTGSADADAIAAQLDALFPLDTLLQAGAMSVYIIQPMSAAAGISRPDRFVIPVSATYRADFI